MTKAYLTYYFSGCYVKLFVNRRRVGSVLSNMTLVHLIIILFGRIRRGKRVCGTQEARMRGSTGFNDIRGQHCH